MWLEGGGEVDGEILGLGTCNNQSLASSTAHVEVQYVLAAVGSCSCQPNTLMMKSLERKSSLSK